MKHQSNQANHRENAVQPPKRQQITTIKYKILKYSDKKTGNLNQK